MPFSSLLAKNQEKSLLKPWRILIVDDEIDIHTITKMALKRFELKDRGVEFLSAFDSKEVNR